MALEPSFNPLAQSILAVSHLAASAEHPQSIVDGIASIVSTAFAASRVSIVAQTWSEVFNSVQATASNTNHCARFLFSRPIAVRGIEYGRIELEIDNPEYPAPDMMLALEAVALLLATWAERLSIQVQQATIAAQLASTKNALASSKLLARASGIISQWKRIPLSAAQAWIKSEARRRHLTPDEFGAKLILDQSIARRIALPNPVRLKRLA